MTEQHRPHDDHYWVRPWSTALFAGDLFDAIPFVGQPTAIFEADDDEGAQKHLVGEIDIAYGLLITPTCDMIDQEGAGRPAHQFRTLLPVVSLEHLVRGVGGFAQNENLARRRDALTPYMYLPPLASLPEGELVACLFRPSIVGDDFLRDPPRRLAQMHPEGRRHLKLKLTRYWGRNDPNLDGISLLEKNEQDLRSNEWPPSDYDDPTNPFADELPAADWWS